MLAIVALSIKSQWRFEQVPRGRIQIMRFLLTVHFKVCEFLSGFYHNDSVPKTLKYFM